MWDLQVVAKNVQLDTLVQFVATHYMTSEYTRVESMWGVNARN